MLKLFLGIVLLIAAVLNIYGGIKVTEQYIFGFSLSVLFMSLASYFEDPLKDIQNKKSFSTIFKYIFIFLSTLSFVLVPLAYSTGIMQTLSKSIDSVTFLLIGIAFSFLTLFSSTRTSNQLKKIIELEKQKSSNEKAEEILKRIEIIKNK